MKTLVYNNEEYPNYLVSTDGLIYSKKTKQYVKPYLSGRYLTVSIANKNRRIVVGVHRVVACTYLPNPEHKECVHHIDGDKENNNVDNLEWMSSYEHIQEHMKLGNWGGQGKPIYCYENKKTYPSIKSACEELNLNLGNVWQVLNGYLGKTGGYTFIYKEYMR